MLSTRSTSSRKEDTTFLFVCPEHILPEQEERQQLNPKDNFDSANNSVRLRPLQISNSGAVDSCAGLHIMSFRRIRAAHPVWPFFSQFHRNFLGAEKANRIKIKKRIKNFWKRQE
jgi:hypothetical protein